MELKLNKKKVVVGISGGVDSAICLKVLCARGFDVRAVYIKMCRYSGSSDGDIRSAQKITTALGIKLKIIDAQKQFYQEVVSYYDDEIKKGNTPSPCIFCNQKVKLAILLDYADRVGAYYVATGHYARIVKKDDLFFLKMALDKNKDQTYSLSFLPQRYLARLILPLGNIKKSETIKMSKDIKGLGYLSGREQSQDFCYLGGVDQTQYCTEKLIMPAGTIIDVNGKVLGRHNGLCQYTIGQRKGIKLPGGPYFVVSKNTQSNKVVVSKDERDLYQDTVVLRPYRLVKGEIKKGIRVLSKLRSMQNLVSARLYQDSDKIVLQFDAPQRAATPGQIAVFYDKEICLGGGVIN